MAITEELSIVAQLILAQEEAAKKLEEFYDRKDIENFRKTKAELENFQKQLSDILGKWQSQI